MTVKIIIKSPNSAEVTDAMFPNDAIELLKELAPSSEEIKNMPGVRVIAEFPGYRVVLKQVGLPPLIYGHYKRTAILVFSHESAVGVANALFDALPLEDKAYHEAYITPCSLTVDERGVAYYSLIVAEKWEKIRPRQP